MKGERPQRPLDPAVTKRGLDDALWDLLERCWAQDPDARPDIFKVKDELDEMWPERVQSESTLNFLNLLDIIVISSRRRLSARPSRRIRPGK